MDDPTSPVGLLDLDTDLDTAAEPVRPTGSPTIVTPEPPTAVTAGLPVAAAPAGTGLMATSAAATSAAGVTRARVPGTQLQTTHGHTTIADVVVARTASHAVRSVDGARTRAEPGTRIVAAVGGRLPGARLASAPGITVEVGARQAAIQVTLTVGYGTRIPELARSVRAAVIHAVETVTGLEVVNVDVAIADLHPSSPGDDHQQPDARTRSTPRVQ